MAGGGDLRLSASRTLRDVRVLASELWWVALVVGSAEGVRRGVSMWVLLPAAYLVDIWLTLQLEVLRPFWLWLLNALLLSVVLQLAKGVSVVESMQAVPDDPPAAPPTEAQRTMAAGLEAEGFVPVAPSAVGPAARHAEGPALRWGAGRRAAGPDPGRGPGRPRR